MTTLEIHAKQAELAKRILNIDSEEVLNKLSETLNALTARMPSVPTDEEVRARANRAVTAFRNGEMHKFTSHEDLKKRHLQ